MNNSTILFSDYLDSEGKVRKREHRNRQCEIYKSIQYSVREYDSCPDLSLKEVYTYDFLSAYQAALFNANYAYNTVYFYISNLRTLYHNAVRQAKLKYTPDLFGGLVTAPIPTKKRALETDTLAILLTADLSDNPGLAHSRDYFVLSFLLQGISYVDLAHLKKSDMVDDHIVYRRRKTKGMVTVSVLPEARALIDRYADEVKDSIYLLPILDPLHTDTRTSYKNALRMQNRHLEALGNRLGIAEHLTTHVARHSWATIGHYNDVSTAMISQGMGHHSEGVTRTYLATFKDDQMMNVNRVVLDAVLAKVPNQCICPDEKDEILPQGGGERQGGGESAQKELESSPRMSEKRFTNTVRFCGNNRHNSASKLVTPYLGGGMGRDASKKKCPSSCR